MDSAGLFATLLAVQLESEEALPAFGSDDPGAIHPGRIVPYVLRMPTLQIGDPVELLVLMETDDLSFQIAPLPLL